MTSWRDRLCGSQVLAAPGDQKETALEQFLHPSDQLSCGGGFFPTIQQNVANLKTHNKNVVLPTDTYSVLIFKDDGSAVIYSDQELARDDEEMEQPKSI